MQINSILNFMFCYKHYGKIKCIHSFVSHFPCYSILPLPWIRGDKLSTCNCSPCGRSFALGPAPVEEDAVVGPGVECLPNTHYAHPRTHPVDPVCLGPVTSTDFKEEKANDFSFQIRLVQVFQSFS